MHKGRDVTANRLGNRPGTERKDPIKRIADPANLESENPAIKKAAQIKADQDLAPQKIKAIKFLATVGCGCYPGVADALLAALDDCTEEVRYEAAVALCQVAGNPCDNCKNGCCNAKIMQKLHDMAFGQDDKCCWKETSARVRAAAELALNSCRNKVGPTAPSTLQPIPEHKEIPLDEPSSGPRETPMPTPAVPTPPAPAGAKAPALMNDNQTSDTMQIIPPSFDDEMPVSIIRTKTATSRKAEPMAKVHMIPPPPAYEEQGNQFVVPATALITPIDPSRTW
jgi:hypothetical protein